MTAKTTQATGIENFCWIAMTSGCGDWPFRTLAAASLRSSAMVFSFCPGWMFSLGKTASGLSPMTVSAGKRLVSIGPEAVIL